MDRLKLLNSKASYEHVFFTVVLGSFICWLLTMYFWGFDGDQWKLFFREGDDFLADMSNIAGYSALRDVYHDMHFSGLFEKAYPPLSYVFAWFISKSVDINQYFNIDSFAEMYMNPHFMIVYLIFLFIALVALYEVIKGVKTGSAHVKVLTAFAIIFSMPMLYTLERGNTLIACLIALFVYLFYYNSENKILRELALVSFGVAVAIKMTPAVLGIMMLYDKKWREAIRGTIYSVVLFFAPFLFMKGGFSNVPQMFSNIQENLDFYSKPEGCSLAGLINTVFDIKGELNVDAINTWAFVLAAVLLLTAILQKTKWKQLLSVLLVLIVLPSHSGFYCIIFVFPAIVMFLNEEKHSVFDWFYMVFFIMISAIIYCMDYSFIPLYGLFLLLCYHVIENIVLAARTGIKYSISRS